MGANKSWDKKIEPGLPYSWTLRSISLIGNYTGLAREFCKKFNSVGCQSVTTTFTHYPETAKLINGPTVDGVFIVSHHHSNWHQARDSSIQRGGGGIRLLHLPSNLLAEFGHSQSYRSGHSSPSCALGLFLSGSASQSVGPFGCRGRTWLQDGLSQSEMESRGSSEKATMTFFKKKSN